MGKIEFYLQEGHIKGASDIHLAPGCPAMYRIDGELVPASGEKIKPYEIEEMVTPLLTKEQQEELKKKGELDFAYSIAGFHRVRFNVFRQRGTYAVALRILAVEIPDARELGLPQPIVDLTNKKRGLVLVTGPTGSGKSTTLASLIHLIADTYPKTIITLEDPIEYLHPHGRSIVLQREIGYDSLSYASALRAALREDPDVILVGELRDLETIQIALTAAETGHLVFAALHTASAVAAIDRMIDVFPPHHQQQTRVQLSDVLEGILTQQLLPREGGGRAAAYEVVLATPAVRSLIRAGKSYQIPDAARSGKRYGMQTMDDAIYDLFMKSRISAEDAVLYAKEPSEMARKVTLYEF